MVQFSPDETIQAWRERYHSVPGREPAARRLASIKIVISAPRFEDDCGEDLTDPMLGWLATLVQEQVKDIPGYYGWEIGWVTCPTTV